MSEASIRQLEMMEPTTLEKDWGHYLEMPRGAADGLLLCDMAGRLPDVRSRATAPWAGTAASSLKPRGPLAQSRTGNTCFIAPTLQALFASREIVRDMQNWRCACDRLA